MNKYTIQKTTAYKKGFKKLIKQGKDIQKLEVVINTLAKGETLAPEYKDHPLKGNYKGYRECHIEPDWLLVYKIVKDKLVLLLAYTDTHSELF